MSRNRLWKSRATTKDVDSKIPITVKSAARAFRIIEFFGEVRRGARANEIVERLGIPQSSASVLLNSLVSLGYLDFEYSTHTYQPTLRVAMLGAWLDTGPFRDGSMLEMIERLAEETGYAIGLSTRIDGLHVRYLHAIQSRDPEVAHIAMSIRRYVIWSSAGMVLLVGTPTDEVKALIRRTRAESDPLAQQIDSAQVLRNLDIATEQGYFFSRGLVTTSAGSISIRMPQSLTGNWQGIALSAAGDLKKMVAFEEDIVGRMREAISRLEQSRGVAGN